MDARDLTQMRDHLMGDLDAVWTPQDASAFLAIRQATLAHWRRTGEGPRYIRLSATRVGYRKRDLLEWIESRLRQSTSEPAAGGSSSGGGTT